MIYTDDTVHSSRCCCPSRAHFRRAVGLFLFVRHQRLSVLPVSPPPNLLRMTSSNIQPPPISNEMRMLRTLKAMYVLLGQTLDGATNSLSTVERMNAACSVVSRTVTTFKDWRASATVFALLQPARDVTDLFLRRSTNG